MAQMVHPPQGQITAVTASAQRFRDHFRNVASWGSALSSFGNEVGLGGTLA
jgi:hypothetical protein